MPLSQTKVFDFVAADKTRRFGTAKVLRAHSLPNDASDGYSTANGGYVLEVISSNYYDTGTIITVSRGGVRHWINGLVQPATVEAIITRFLNGTLSNSQANRDLVHAGFTPEAAKARLQAAWAGR